MRPILFDFSLPLLGRVEFPAYMTFILLGFAVAIWLAGREADRVGLPRQRIVDLGILMLVLGVAGARLLSVLSDGMLMDFVHICTDPTKVAAVDGFQHVMCTTDEQCGPYYLCDVARRACYPPRDCLAALKFWQGGMTYYGGFLLAVPGGLWYARRHQLGAWRVADLAAPLIMLGLFFGRLGCFFTGCCYGAATDTWLGVRFPPTRSRPGIEPLHPTQLYEALGVLALAAILYLVIRPRKRGHGEVFGWLLGLYGAMRFALELLRADPRGALGPLSTSQLLSLPLVAVGVWLILRARRETLVGSPR
jgi:phosphatidylglycerol:prolipoprotein diacylglycerol transferase